MCRVKILAEFFICTSKNDLNISTYVIMTVFYCVVDKFSANSVVRTIYIKIITYFTLYSDTNIHVNRCTFTDI